MQKNPEAFIKKFMEQILFTEHYDLATPDGSIVSIKPINETTIEATVSIENISSAFVGFTIDKNCIFFNLKSTLAQAGMHTEDQEIQLNYSLKSANVRTHIKAYSNWAKQLLALIQPGAYVGKLFAKDERRRVRSADYLLRLFGREDFFGSPLLSLGNLDDKKDLILEEKEGRLIAYLSLKKGRINYDEKNLEGFLPTLAKALHYPDYHLRRMLQLHQYFDKEASRVVQEKEMLLVRTTPLHIRTLFAKVAVDLLPPGYQHTSASVLEPYTKGSGDVYEFFGSSDREIDRVPLEFYTLEPFREYVYFSDRDALQKNLNNPDHVFKAFETAPEDTSCATLVFKGDELFSLTSKRWVVKQTSHDPSFPLLKSIEEGYITSQGILLTRFFPAPYLKKWLLAPHIQRCLKRIYFQVPSESHSIFFSVADRRFLRDLAEVGIEIYWVDENCKKILQYQPKNESGMFVLPETAHSFSKSSFFGIYGNSTHQLEQQLHILLESLKESIPHLALINGTTRPALSLCSRLGQNLNILFCANISNSIEDNLTAIHYDALMTYRHPPFGQKEGELRSDFPIFLPGDIEIDMEQCHEEWKRKAYPYQTPVLLLGPVEYWQQKITPRFQSNKSHGTDWLSNCFYCVQSASSALKVYEDFFSKKLKLGPEGPIYKDGFAIY